MEIMLFLFGIFIGIPISYGIYGILTFIIESLFGRKVYSFKYLIFSYTKSTGFHTCNFSPICEISMQKENDTEKQIMTSFIIKTVLYDIVCAVLTVITVVIYRYDILPLFITALTAGIALWFDIDIFMRIIFLIKSTVNSKKPLNTNYHTIIKKMLDGVPFGEIEVPDPRTYNCKTDKSTLAKYQHLFFMNRVWHDDKKSVSYAVQSMELCIDMNYALTDKAYLQAYTDVYYDLLFYYSFIDIQKYRAEKIFDIIAPDLLTDNDSNGYRTLAYYNYFILGNMEATELYIRKGLELIYEFPIVSQREYEKMLLINLLKEFSDSLIYTDFFHNP